MRVRQGFMSRFAAQTQAVTRLRDMVRSQSQIAISGLEVQTPSDAAGRWTRIQNLEDLLRDQSVYMRNANTAQGALSVAEGALAQGANLILEAREIAVRMASETSTDEDRAGMVGRIEGIREELIGLGNLQFAGRSVFSGTAYQRDAFSQTGLYQGDQGTGTIVVGDGQTVQTSFVGEELFGDGLAVLQNLAFALGSGPGSADTVAAELTNLDEARERLVRGRQQVGFESIDAEDARTLADSLQLTFQESVNDELSADPIEAYTLLSESQQSYEVALQVTAQVTSTNLFDFLR